MKTKTERVISVSDWDETVSTTYGRHYCFQQQDGCRDRGLFRFSVPAEADDFDRDTIPEEVNHETMGVSFAAWLQRDPQALLDNEEDKDDWCRDLWWERNFYPDLQMVANDLHAKGLLEAGDYVIEIDW